MRCKKTLLFFVSQTIAVLYAVRNNGTESESRSSYFETRENKQLMRYVVKGFDSPSLLSCSRQCLRNEWCTSTSFKLSPKNDGEGTCELNKHDISVVNENINFADIYKEGVTFSMLLKPAKTPLCSRTVQPSSQCDCSFTSESACRPNEGSYHRLPISCKQIWENCRICEDGSFYIETNTTAEYAHVFCHMTPIPGCGDGGWTLVMKIDGGKQTFTYDAPYWNDTVGYNEDAGTNLDDTETKLSSFWSTPFTRLCLGMKDLSNKETNWIALNHAGSSLKDVIGNGTFQATDLNITEWKKLLNDSQIQDSCNMQGFNSDNKVFSSGAKARIGIIGFPISCNDTAQSRIGFGTAGSYYNMDNSNSCGNELRGDSRIKAFGYIFVQ